MFDGTRFGGCIFQGNQKDNTHGAPIYLGWFFQGHQKDATNFAPSLGVVVFKETNRTPPIWREMGWILFLGEPLVDVAHVFPLQ